MNSRKVLSLRKENFILNELRTSEIPAVCRSDNCAVVFLIEVKFIHPDLFCNKAALNPDPLFSAFHFKAASNNH